MPSQIPKNTPEPTGYRSIDSDQGDSPDSATVGSGSLASGRKVSAVSSNGLESSIKAGRSLEFSKKVDRPLASRMFSKLTTAVKRFFSKGSYSPAKAAFKGVDRSTLWAKQDKLPDNPLKAKQISIDSALAQYPYKHNDKEVDQAHKVDGGLLAQEAKNPEGFSQLTLEEGSGLSEFMGVLNQSQQFEGRLKQGSGLIYDTKTGFVATVFKDGKTGQVKIVFGGTTAGQKLPFPDDKKLLFRQTVADAANFIGSSIPECYEQAANMARLAKEHFDPNGQDKVSLTGHSLGGGMAQYAGAMEQLPANCFSAAALGKAALTELNRQGALDPDWIKGNITQVMIKGDPVSNPLGLDKYSSHFAATNLGTRIVLEGQSWKYGDPVVGRHMLSHKHVHTAVQNHLKR
ncbi:alpha/beta hydrolase family protein [Sansalvadorimonas verongulae]|uniref:alpha/beta hydrolase family protein n=1 Tax=Sansalvadorimonas verongulae TaxID=2172824 RepID=UPI0012BD4B09|nr:hypothetical protein [Sansalvadorimonas verongulae]MTI15022.1 hypothetical protein [Sansalvadorimonas verongulae]